MIRLPPRSTRTDTPFPYTTLFRSPASKLSGKRTEGRPSCGFARTPLQARPAGHLWTPHHAQDALPARPRTPRSLRRTPHRPQRHRDRADPDRRRPRLAGCDDRRHRPRPPPFEVRPRPPRIGDRGRRAGENPVHTEPHPDPPMHPRPGLLTPPTPPPTP